MPAAGRAAGTRPPRARRMPAAGRAARTRPSRARPPIRNSDAPGAGNQRACHDRRSRPEDLQQSRRRREDSHTAMKTACDCLPSCTENVFPMKACQVSSSSSLAFISRTNFPGRTARLSCVCSGCSETGCSEQVFCPERPHAAHRGCPRPMSRTATSPTSLPGARTTRTRAVRRWASSSGPREQCLRR